jgi:NTP pyrophosphatase (non-canonical NTP hydrolase)
MTTSNYIAFVEGKLMKLDARQLMLMCALGLSGEAAEFTAAIERENFESLEASDSEMGDIIFYTVGMLLMMRRLGFIETPGIYEAISVLKSEEIPGYHSVDETLHIPFVDDAVMCKEFLMATAMISEQVKKFVFHAKENYGQVNDRVRYLCELIGRYMITSELNAELIFDANHKKLTTRYGDGAAPTPTNSMPAMLAYVN